jgi:hypothetical protein
MCPFRHFSVKLPSQVTRSLRGLNHQSLTHFPHKNPRKSTLFNQANQTIQHTPLHAHLNLTRRTKISSSFTLDFTLCFGYTPGEPRKRGSGARFGAPVIFENRGLTAGIESERDPARLKFVGRPANRMLDSESGKKRNGHGATRPLPRERPERDRESNGRANRLPNGGRRLSGDPPK